MEMQSLSDLFNMPNPAIKANIPINQQIALWATGVSVHNPITGRHCPDFSCCIPALASPMADREKFEKSIMDGRNLLTAGLLRKFLAALHDHYGVCIVFRDISEVYGYKLN